ncbi:MAG: hypothetical protein U0800_02430 [Isosphaeraceae bacterium]
MARVALTGRNREQDLPDRCIHCGQPSTGRVERTFGWTPPHRRLLAVPAFLLLLALMVALQASSTSADNQLAKAILGRRTTKLAVPTCNLHRKPRRGWVAWLVFGGIALFALAVLGLLAALGNSPSLLRLRAFLLHPATLATVVAATIAWLIVVVRGWSRSIRAVRIEGDDLVLVRVDEGFARAYAGERERVAALLREPPADT